MIDKFNITIKSLKNITKDIKKEYQEISKELIREIKHTHDLGMDPYKKRWKSTRNMWPTLKKTGKLRNSYSRKQLTSGFSITNKAGYAGYHQKGTKFLPIRKLLPDDAGRLPKHWEAIIKKRLERMLKLKLKK